LYLYYIYRISTYVIIQPMKGNNQPDRIAAGTSSKDDTPLDSNLRPKRLNDFIGQEKVKDNLIIGITAAKKRNDTLEHVLIYGPPGLGKTTLAHIIASEIGVNIKISSGPAIERPGDLAAILTNLQKGDVLFIDEIHRLSKVVEEILYPAMEDYALDLIIGKGPGARNLRLNLPKFTLIGATTRFALVSSPLRDRFGAVYRVDYYDPQSLKTILKRSANILKISADDKSLEMISSRSRGTPRIANRLLKRVRDFAQVKAEGVINSKIADDALTGLEIDSMGLDIIDHKILHTIIEKFDGGPVGLDTIAASISEESDTIMDVYEPYLLQLGFLERTPRGRITTELAYRHLGIQYKTNRTPQSTLW
jgi:holliday junction DNA helicase RuvB